ncbi:MAG TPA: DUF2116 family Zn-ribbon domain-containing protein [Saprospiraceae bacterium]|nr:DUF2116 family Zn-ribbon domain-containing protein [Saprospiraceae bacterium]HMP25821.1 DUF2116 family Zn-ribbon domain-containing protein [Saprospiraceae bacterium]
MKNKGCIECGEAIIGRQDKRFCSDQCRSAFNNRLNSDATNFIRNINNILRKNRRILFELNPDGKAKIHKDKLLERGFKFGYFTNEYVTKAGKVYRFCYDQGYLPLEQDYYALVVRQEYVE